MSGGIVTPEKRGGNLRNAFLRDEEPDSPGRGLSASSPTKWKRVETKNHNQSRTPNQNIITEGKDSEGGGGIGTNRGKIENHEHLPKNNS